MPTHFIINGAGVSEFQYVHITFGMRVPASKGADVNLRRSMDGRTHPKYTARTTAPNSKMTAAAAATAAVFELIP